MRNTFTSLRTIFGSAVLFLCFSLQGFAGLARLEEIVSPYATMDEFLKDEEKLLEYREAYKDYLGEEGDSFNPVFKAFIAQMKDVSNSVPGFSKQVWTLNPNWQEQSYYIQGEFSGSGLQAKREALLKAIKKFTEEVGMQAEPLSRLDNKKRTQEINRLESVLKTQYGLKSSEEVSRMNRKARGEYSAQLRNISNSPEAKLLADFITHSILSKNENVKDALFSADADIVSKELHKLEKPINYKQEINDLGLGIPEELLGYLKFSNPTQQSLLKHYQNGVSSIKAFQHISDARIDPDLLAELQRLQGEGIPLERVHSHLQPDMREKLDRWKNDSQRSRENKQAFADEHNKKNEFYFYELHEDPARATLRLKTQGGLKLHFIPSPRPFHASMAGRKTLECVGGRDCSALSPRRWVRGALKGANTIFTETGDDKMEGFMGLTPVVHSKKELRYEVVDIMSKAIKGDIAIRAPDGRVVKYSFFDQFVDRQPLPKNSEGFVMSDGNSVSQNVGGSEVVLYSPAYTEKKVVGKPDNFFPLDSMAQRVIEKYPGGMYGGDIIYDGMKGDGENVFLLVPSKDRKKWSKRQLENQIRDLILNGHEIDDRNPIWKRALESGVTLDTVDFYRRKVEEELRDFNNTLKYHTNKEKYPNFARYYFDKFLKKNLTDPEIQKSILDYLEQKGFPVFGGGELEPKLVQSLGKVHLEKDSSERIANEVIKVLDGNTPSFSIMAKALIPGDPSWSRIIDKLSERIKSLEEERDQINYFRKVVMDGLQRTYGDWHSIRPTGPPELIERIFNLLDQWAKLIRGYNSKHPYSNEQLDGYADEYFKSFALYSQDLRNHPTILRLFMTLPIDSNIAGKYALESIELIKNDPNLFDLFMDYAANRNSFGILETLRNWIKENPESKIDSRKVKFLKRLTKKQFGLYRRLLATMDYFFISGSSRFIATRGKYVDSWEDIRFDQERDVLWNREREFKELWPEIKAGGPNRSRWKNLKADCASALEALQDLKSSYHRKRERKRQNR